MEKTNKIDIIIKSFNRVFYLDRSIFSIYKYVTNFRNIIVLDDGTPNVFLEKLHSKYPNLIIKKSDSYLEKSENSSRGLEMQTTKIPSELWIEAVKKSDDYVLVIEDDVWFVDHIDINSIVNEMITNNSALTKIAWQSDSRYSQNILEKEISNNLVSQFPNKKLIVGNDLVMSSIINNKYKALSILCRVGFYNNQSINEYYNFLSISMGIYRKDFWLYTWKDARERALEVDLMKNAVVWWYKNGKHPNTITRTTKEYLKTTYISSATSAYHRYNIDFDIMKFNLHINNLWYKDQFDILQNFPNDFTRDYFTKCLLKEDVNFDIPSFYTWTHAFMEQFNKLDLYD